MEDSNKTNYDECVIDGHNMWAKGLYFGTKYVLCTFRLMILAYFVLFPFVERST